MVFSQDGIFSRAEQAADKHGEAKARETLELALGEAQMQKYEQGLTDEQLTGKINAIGEELPKEKPEHPELQNVIVDGHIFEIDRSVPKIIDYIGPADGVIITAQVTQNGDWKNPVATVTGTITKYGGGTVTNSSATATNGVIISSFPTTGGSYTIPNITADTDITITASADDGKPAVTKTIQVRLVRDNTPPVLSEIDTSGSSKFTIRFTATATDSQSGLKETTPLHYEITPATGLTTNTALTKISADFNSGETVELTSTEKIKYTITVTAEDKVGNTSEAKTATVTTSDAISVEEAKRLVTNMETLQQYIGTKVNYKTGETWRIFYYDEEEKNEDGTGKGVGYFGKKNTLYLKRYYGEVPSVGLTISSKTDTSDPAVLRMRAMNPKWRDREEQYISDTINENEKACIWLCDPEVWDKQRNPLYSSFAVGSPSVEMFMKAYNVYKTGNQNSTNLVCKVESKLGYSVGTNNDYSTSKGFATAKNSLEKDSNEVFITSTYVHLASPSARTNYYTMKTNNIENKIDSEGYNYSWGLEPVVPLDL